ncbi:SpoIID/LytB domain-containing protein [Nocardia arizonensis]|uniref:SpoIID/LytB domain-containing protein n=1 Tax=Nocardia arizonensis TaxID=1141647 RepID=UPI000A4F7843|nr:SpoIID/LytB domain-containing protein [Nocardia arizonensis]
MRHRTQSRKRVAMPRTVFAPARAVAVTAGAAALLATMWMEWDTPGDTPYLALAGPGHGRGMSQLGAFDSARDGWNAERILEHYYPGATFGTVPRTTVGVRLTAQDDSTLDVGADTGLRVAGRRLDPGQVAHLRALPDGKADVVVTAGCDGEVLWQGATADPWVYPIDPNPGRPAAEHLTLCGGSAYRGALGLALENGAARTVNRVDVEDYLRGLVPAEVQANWADEGAHEALRAQAVAARSYALAEHRYPYAQTCDTTDCQFYPGTELEDQRTADAVAATAGTVLLRDGRILRAEYSATPDGGEPADIGTFEVGPAPAELAIGKPPTDPRVDAAAESAIAAEYRRIGGARSAVGAPLGPELRLPQNAGSYRMFTNGVIIATPTLGAQVVDFTRLMELAPDVVRPQSDSRGVGGPGARPPIARPNGVGAAPEAVAPESEAPAPESATPGAAVPDVTAPGASVSEEPVPGAPAPTGAQPEGDVGQPDSEPAPDGSENF